MVYPFVNKLKFSKDNLIFYFLSKITFREIVIYFKMRFKNTNL